MTASEAVWPCIVQGSERPAFHCSGAGQLVCRGCGHVLVEGYAPRLFAAVDFECFRCQSVTRTPCWPAGEPLPRPVVSLGESGRYRLVGTVDKRSGDVVFASAQEIARVEMGSGIRSPENTRHGELSLEGLNAIEIRLSGMLDGFQSCMQRTRKARRSGNLNFLKYPPAWALVQLQESISASDGIDLDSPDATALATLHGLLGLLPRWQHHERFPAMCAALLNEFDHSMAQLIAASYLADAGNAIGFGEPGLDGGRSPDLFVNMGAYTRHSLEVKAPTELRWPCSMPSRDRLKRIVKDAIKASRGQITHEDGGVLVLGASIDNPEFPGLIRSVIEQLVKDEGVTARISGVVVVIRSLDPNARIDLDILNLTSSSEIFFVRNPAYSGPIKIRTQAR